MQIIDRFFQIDDRARKRIVQRERVLCDCAGIAHLQRLEHVFDKSGTAETADPATAKYDQKYRVSVLFFFRIIYVHKKLRIVAIGNIGAFIGKSVFIHMSKIKGKKAFQFFGHNNVGSFHDRSSCNNRQNNCTINKEYSIILKQSNRIVFKIMLYFIEAEKRIAKLCRALKKWKFFRRDITKCVIANTNYNIAIWT